MKYFSGFCLDQESELFETLYQSNDYTVVGFSHGAQKALEYSCNSTDRIDKLILISPAYFNLVKPSFVKAQEFHYTANKNLYMKNFYDNVAYPLDSNILQKYIKDGNKDELSELLRYKWDTNKLTELQEKGIIIEVFMGQKDKIVNTQDSLRFFENIVNSVFVFKDYGHLLVGEK